MEVRGREGGRDTREEGRQMDRGSEGRRGREDGMDQDVRREGGEEDRVHDFVSICPFTCV